MCNRHGLVVAVGNERVLLEVAPRLEVAPGDLAVHKLWNTKRLDTALTSTLTVLQVVRHTLLGLERVEAPVAEARAVSARQSNGVLTLRAHQHVEVCDGEVALAEFEE